MAPGRCYISCRMPGAWHLMQEVGWEHELKRGDTLVGTH